MKVQQLRLTAVGPFTQYRLDLSGGRRGLHLIHGDNEAGKSSTLRALRYLLFGFPSRLSDDFLHPYGALRVGAVLTSDRDEVLDITRRKANRKSLRDGDDEALVQEETLRAFLGNASEELFTTSFAIDHPTLVRGGEEIVLGQGDVGQVLLASSGIAGLREVEDQLTDEAKSLFAPRGRNQTIHRLIGGLKAARKSVREHQLSAAEWERHQKSLDQLRQRKEQIDSQRTEQRARRESLQRLFKAIPHVHRYQQRLTHARTLDDVILLPDDFDQRREQLLRALDVARAREETTTAEIADREARIASLDVPRHVLDRGHEIARFEERLHRFLDSQSDRPSVLASLRLIEDRLRGALRDLGQPDEVDRAADLLLPMADRLRVRRLAAEYQSLAALRDENAERVAQTKTDWERKRSELADLPAERDPASLEQAVRLAMRLGDIDQELADCRQQQTVLEKDLANARARLPAWNGTDQQLVRLAVPAVETVETFGDRFRRGEEDLRAMDSSREECRQELERVEREIDGLSRGDRVPTEAMLQAARARRDQAWQLLRRMLAGEAVAPTEWENLVEQAEIKSADLAMAYEKLVQVSDDLSDRLRREADRVAHHAQLETRGRQLQARIEQIAELQGEHRQSAERIEQQWQALWRPLGIEPRSPREMTAWLQQHATIVEQGRETGRLGERIGAIEEKIETHRRRIRHAMGQLDATMEADETSLLALLDQAEQVLDVTRAWNARRGELERDLERLDRQRRRYEAVLAEAERKWSAWQHAWKQATAGLPAGIDVGPDEVGDLLERFNQLERDLDMAEKERGRLREIDDYARTFRADARALARHVLPQRSFEAPEEELAAAMLARYHTAKEMDQEVRRLETECRQRRDVAEEAVAQVRACQKQLDGLCAEAACNDVRGLPEAFKKSCEKHQVEQELAALRQHLVDLAGSVELAAFVEQARSTQPDILQDRIGDLDTEIQTLEAELVDQVMPAIGQEQEILNRMDTSGAAADAMETVRDSLVSLDTTVRQYATWKLAAHCLRHGLARYRERHQGTMMTTAGDVFARLTTGAFSGLRVDYNRDGQPVLMGVRAGTDETVSVAAMSDGTADQLYLSLRYAWLMAYLDKHESLPLVVDDILIRFDDRRSRETLGLLGELSARTQVLFFTHHRHLVDLARDVLDDEVLYVHQLATNETLCHVPSNSH